MDKVVEYLEAKVNPTLNFAKVEDVIRKKSYGVINTVTKDGRPHSAGVLYAVSEGIGLLLFTSLPTRGPRRLATSPEIRTSPLQFQFRDGPVFFLPTRFSFREPLSYFP